MSHSKASAKAHEAQVTGKRRLPTDRYGPLWGGHVLVRRWRRTAGQRYAPRAMREAGLLGIVGHELAQALHRVDHGVCAVASNGRVLFWNRAAERILGYPAREVIGQPCREFLDEPRALRRGGTQDPLHRLEVQTRTRDGRAVWLDVRILTLPGTTSTSAHGRENRDVRLHVFRDATADVCDVKDDRVAFPVSDAVLTRREIEVLRLLTQGARTKPIAAQLRVSPATVRNHVQNLLRKLNAHSRLEAVAYARRHRLL